MPLAESGNFTPVIWGDKILLTQANKGGGVRGLLCLSRADGKLLWQKDVTYDDTERSWKPDFYCSASPATDGERVVACFGSANPSKLRWRRRTHFKM